MTDELSGTFECRRGSVRAMRTRALPALAMLALLLALPAASAQTGPPPGPRGFGGFGSLQGFTVTAPATVEVQAGGTATATFHVAYAGNATLDVTFGAREFGGFGGRTRGNFTGPPPGTTFTGRPDRRNFTGMPPFGRRGGGNLTFAAVPAQATLMPGDEGDVTLTVTAASTATAGDHLAAFLVRGQGGIALQRFTVHVTAAPGAHASPAWGLLGTGAVLALAATARRRAP